MSRRRFLAAVAGTGVFADRALACGRRRPLCWPAVPPYAGPPGPSLTRAALLRTRPSILAMTGPQLESLRQPGGPQPCDRFLAATSGPASARANRSSESPAGRIRSKALETGPKAGMAIARPLGMGVNSPVGRFRSRIDRVDRVRNPTGGLTAARGWAATHQKGSAPAGGHLSRRAHFLGNSPRAVMGKSGTGQTKGAPPCYRPDRHGALARWRWAGLIFCHAAERRPGR